MLNLLKYAEARLGEASTFNAIAIALAALHYNVDPGLLHTLTVWGAMVATVLGAIIPEIGTGRTPLGVASDAFAAFVAAIRAAPPGTFPTATAAGTADPTRSTSGSMPLRMALFGAATALLLLARRSLPLPAWLILLAAAVCAALIVAILRSHARTFRSERASAARA
jgi:hypothetical protein